MKTIKIFLLAAMVLSCCLYSAAKKQAKDLFPDGTPIPEWFSQVPSVSLSDLGKAYLLNQHGVSNDSTLVQTEKIQAVIDLAAQNGGGVVVVPKGTFLSGSLFFKQGTHLYLEEGAVLKGSDDISDFALLPTRLEGQNLKYFAALVNADGLDGFTVAGKGTINGNGLRYWKSFWLRRGFNPKCTNLDEMRPRLLYVSHSKNVRVADIRLVNSPFWTTHFYKCENVKLTGLYIFAPKAPVKAPSSDAVDIDVCRNFLVKNCYISVNDDGVVLKGGKGPWADQDPNNGMNENVIVEDCTYGFSHGVLTCGSESIHNRNIIVRRCQISNAQRLLWLKMRPDTPQRYEYITIEDISGDVAQCVYIKPWTQFYDLKGRQDIPMSYGDRIVMRNINLECATFFNVSVAPDQYELSNFHFENMNVRVSKDATFNTDAVKNFTIKDVTINAEKVK